MSETLVVARDGDVVTVTLNEPDVGNALNDAQIVALGDVIEREQDQARLIVLRGAGADFCVGRRSGPRPATPPEALRLRALSDHVFRCYGLLRRSPAPVLAVVQGRALGFGFALAAAADMTIAAEDAQFQIPEFNHNIMPTMVMSAMIDRVPLKALMHHVWTATTISAEKAMAIGAVSDVVAPGELQAAAQTLIDRLAAAPRPAVLAVKEYGLNAQAIDMGKAVAYARSLHAMVNASAEMRPASKPAG